jgi:hypothetical protein
LHSLRLRRSVCCRSVLRVMHRRSGEYFVAEDGRWCGEPIGVTASVYTSWSVREVADVLLGDGSPLGCLDPAGVLPHVGLYFLKAVSDRWVRVANVFTPKGRRMLDEALVPDRTGVSLSLVMWGVTDPVHSPGGDEQWVTLSSRDSGTQVRFHVLLEDVGVVVPFVVGLVERCGVVCGGAWGSVLLDLQPPWASRHWLWQTRFLPDPWVRGPTWLVVAGAGAHGVLSGDRRARELACAVDEVAVDGGVCGVWRLTESVLGPSGEVLAEWTELMRALGVLWPDCDPQEIHPGDPGVVRVPAVGEH